MVLPAVVEQVMIVAENYTRADLLREDARFVRVVMEYARAERKWKAEQSAE